MPRPVRADLDFQGTSRVSNLPAPLESGDAVNLEALNQAVAGVVAGQLPQVISEDLTVSGTAVMFRSVDVAAGVTVTVEPDSAWVVYQ